MNEVVKKLAEISNEFGEQVLSEKRIISFIKDYFPEAKREQKLIEKGVELGLYRKFRDASVSEILILREQIVKELYKDHGLNREFAEDSVELWIRLIEVQRSVTIVSKPFSKSDTLHKAVKFYKKLVQKDKKRVADLYNKNADNPIEKDTMQDDSAVYDTHVKISLPANTSTQDSEEEKIVINDEKEEKIKNLNEALALYEKEANNNNANAQSVLGSLYYSGNSVNKNDKEAAKWFKKAAEQGEVVAQNNLGYCYFYGRGVEKNIEMAIFWFEKAAKKGEESAIMSLANCYYAGMGVKRDILTAIAWYSCAAEKGNSTAQFIIGECYYKGDGVPKNKIKALRWFERAAKQNHAEAAERVTELAYYKKIAESRESSDNKLQNCNKLHVTKFISSLLNPITDDDLLNHIVYQENKSDILSIVKNKVTGLGVNLEREEHILFLFHDKENHILKFSDALLFTTNGLYISKKLRKVEFIYYADIFAIRYDEKGIYINRHLINCFSLSEESKKLLVSIANKIAKEYK